jgi:hypothetical protein
MAGKTISHDLNKYIFPSTRQSIENKYHELVDTFESRYSKWKVMKRQSGGRVNHSLGQLLLPVTLLYTPKRGDRYQNRHMIVMGEWFSGIILP